MKNENLTVGEFIQICLEKSKTDNIVFDIHYENIINKTYGSYKIHYENGVMKLKENDSTMMINKIKNLTVKSSTKKENPAKKKELYLIETKPEWGTIDKWKKH